MRIDAVISCLHKQRNAQLDELKELLRIPSISTLPEHKPDMLRTADWIVQRMVSMGLEHVQAMPTSHNPIIYGDWLHAPDQPTLLVYGHYDVQPVDPLNEWDTPPFAADIRGEYIYARGASDMKGQLFAQLAATGAWLAQGALPVNVKYMLEGDEEVGSPALQRFIEEHRELLQCDAALNCDSGIYAPDAPSITYSLRGLAYFEIEVVTASHDLHSGMFGGTVRNPIHILCEAIAGMHDQEGRIRLPNFYDPVRTLEPEERAVLNAVPHSDDEWRAHAGVRALFGESGYTTLERLGARPSLDVNGIWGGFQGEGAKTVLPARATAKLSMRLVADQQLKEAEAQLRAYLESCLPADCTWTLSTHSMGPGAIMNRDSRYMKAAAESLTRVFGKAPFFRREGASVPVVGMMQAQLGVDSIMLGFALPDDGIHGPNERQSLPMLYKGMECHALFLALTGGIG